jgi:hypothetical protein
MTAVATGPVDIGTGANNAASCPKVIQIGLVGQTTSTWASDAILKVSTALKTDSDGYQLTWSMNV